jgi:1-acyl-sn-glycerol-3-phosphate acyltransferase
MIAVDRSGGGAALRRMLRAASEAAQDDQQIVIFPEGTRTAPGERPGLQPGIVGIAAATGAPVVPVATDSGLVWGRRAFLKRPGFIQISVRSPLPANLPRGDLLAALAEAIEFGPESAPALVEKPVDAVDRAVRVSREDRARTP